MYSINFWKTWLASYQRIFFIVIGLLIVSVVFLWRSNLLTPAPVISAEQVQQLDPLPVAAPPFHLGTTTLSVPVDAYLLLEHVFGGTFQPNVSAPYYFLFLLITSILILLTVITTLSRFWFFMGMGLFILVVTTLRLDELHVAGLASPWLTLAVLAIYVFPAYYFVFLRPSISFGWRLATFTVITIAVGALVAVAARHASPTSFLATNGIIVGTLLTVVFVFMVAHEIIASFIFVITRRTQKKSLIHFLWITAIYLINLALIYANKKHVIHWNFFPVSLFLLLTLSAIIGLWGFRQREPQYESILRADPFGSYLYIALATICFATSGYYLATANDPGVQFFQDAILYSHLGYGLIFFIYVIVNFMPLLGENKPVHKVLYKPTFMPYFTFRFAGLIATFAFFAYSNWLVSLNQVYASYYNSVGDFHVSQDSGRLAETYYQRSVFFATRNYHAHYALAQLASGHGDAKEEQKEYSTLVDGRPLDLAYLNLAQIYYTKQDFEGASVTLKKGLIDFPNNGLLQNALSLVDNRRGLQDSALLLANAARSSTLSKEFAEANVAAFSTRFGLNFPADSMMNILNRENPGVKANVLALAVTQQKAIIADVDPGMDTVLSVHAAAAINNYFINSLNPVDTAFVAKVVRLARRPSNSVFKTILLSAAAHASYRSGEKANAFALMHEIAFLGQNTKYYDALGLWALQQGTPQTAMIFFDEATRLNSPTSYYHWAIALTEAREKEKALAAWDSLSRTGKSEHQQIAVSRVAMLKATLVQAQSFSDEEKYEFSRHYFPASQGQEFGNFVGTIENQELRVRAIVDRVEWLEETDDTSLALAAIALIKGLRFQDEGLYDKVQHLQLRFLARQQQWPSLEKQLQSNIKFKDDFILDKSYFNALLAEHAGRKDEAEKLFAALAKADPFFEDAVVAAAAFRNKNGENKVKTYSLLRAALDHNPNSVKLLKAYILQSVAVEFEDSAQEALDKLKAILHPAAFLQFINENAGIFEVTPN